MAGCWRKSCRRFLAIDCPVCNLRRAPTSGRSRSDDADELGLPEFAHAVEGFDRDFDLGDATRVVALLQRVPDDVLVAADGGFDFGVSIVARRLLPVRPSVRIDGGNVQVSLLATPPQSPRHRLLAWMHDEQGMRISRDNGIVHEAPVMAPSAMNDAGATPNCSSKGSTCEASSTSLSVRSHAVISPLSASMPMCSLRQARRLKVPRFSNSHSRAPRSFSPVQSTIR